MVRQGLYSRRRILASLIAAGTLAACGESSRPPAPQTQTQLPVSTRDPSATHGAIRETTRAVTVPTPAVPTPAMATPAVVTPAVVTQITAKQSSPRSPPEVDDGLRRLAAYGFQAHLYNQDRNLLTNRTIEAGFGWLKQQVEWSQTEPIEKGGFDWRELDKVVEDVNQNCVSNVLLVNT